ncbi:OLC1v1035836C3 [Oldenlandia corymbosa var. corymbosa]|uniref:OLC1v1035836C3 n=1 Tax=Oldenlandia corymbosa var. corymbosa TaxID=529605 RepID=A0AAV1CTZ5_OLDCO|nr:OLC1v1035836C3 [Oldenlandia corymbosa var. corymbosa]
MLYHLQMKHSVQDYQPQNYHPVPAFSSSEPYQSNGFCISPPISSPFISFPNSSNSRDFSLYQGIGRKESGIEEMSKMISFGSAEYSTSSSSEANDMVEYGQPIVKKASSFRRTPLQAKYHLMAERKRREKLLQQFIALSALVPGLEKLNKMSIMDGAIDHMKQLEKRLKTLSEHPHCRMKHDEQDQSCSSQSDEIIRTRVDHSWNDIQIKVVKPDVLIRVTCESRTGRFHEEEFVSEMNNLNLSVTNYRFMPFGDNKLVASAVAKVKFRHFPISISFYFFSVNGSIFCLGPSSQQPII